MIIDELVKDWRLSGVEEGDVLMIHSSLRRTFEKYRRRSFEISPEIVLESFIKAVGESGTLFFPLFNYGFTKGIAFDLRNTPSEMGKLSEAARTDARSFRTKHPIFSFAVIGKNAEELGKIDNFSGWGNDSPFAKLLELNGKVALLDCLNATMIHHAEEVCGVPYRFHKSFTGKYLDENGFETEKTYSFYARNIEMGVVNHLVPIKEMLRDSGIYTFNKNSAENILRVGDGRQIFEFVADVIKSGKTEGVFYKIEEK